MCYRKLTKMYRPSIFTALTYLLHVRNAKKSATWAPHRLIMRNGRETERERVERRGGSNCVSTQGV